MMIASIDNLKDIWIPLITALISLISVFIAFMALLYSRHDRKEQQAAAALDAERRERERKEQQAAAAADAERREHERKEQQAAAAADAERREHERKEQQAAAAADARRREQESLLLALQGDKESVGFLALQLIQEPKLITNENQNRMFDALCLAFLFASSSRARALIFRALKHFSKDSLQKKLISNRLEQIHEDVKEYEKEFEPDSLTKYRERLERLQDLVAT